MPINSTAARPVVLAISLGVLVAIVVVVGSANKPAAPESILLQPQALTEPAALGRLQSTEPPPLLTPQAPAEVSAQLALIKTRVQEINLDAIPAQKKTAELREEAELLLTRYRRQLEEFENIDNESSVDDALEQRLQALSQQLAAPVQEVQP